jgi:hypothetical protein
MEILEIVIGAVFAAFVVWLVTRIANRIGREQTLSDRLLLVIAAATVCGICCAIFVMLGKWNAWPGFSVESGYWGTHFLDSMLYSLGNSDVAVKVVAVIWFIYGAAIGAGTAAIGIKTFSPNRPLDSKRSRPDEITSETPSPVNHSRQAPESK